MAVGLECPVVGLVKWNRMIDPQDPRVDADVKASCGRHASVLAAATQGRAFAVVTCRYQRLEGEGRLDLAEKQSSVNREQQKVMCSTKGS